MYEDNLTLDGCNFLNPDALMLAAAEDIGNGFTVFLFTPFSAVTVASRVSSWKCLPRRCPSSDKLMFLADDSLLKVSSEVRFIASPLRLLLPRENMFRNSAEKRAIWL